LGSGIDRIDRTDGFAQAHVISQNHSSPASGEDGAPFLVGQKFCLQDSIQRIPSTPHLCEELAFQIQPLGEFIFPVEVFQHVAVDDRVEVGLMENLDHSIETPVVLRAQQAGWIEVLLGQLPQGRRWIGRKAQSNNNRFAVLQRDGGACPGKFAALESPAIAFAKPQEEGLDVLTGSQRIDGEVRARAIVLEQTRTAHSYAVRFPAGRFDAIIAVRLSPRPFQDFGDGSGRPFPPSGTAHHALLFDHSSIAAGRMSVCVSAAYDSHAGEREAGVSSARFHQLVHPRPDGLNGGRGVVRDGAVTPRKDLGEADFVSFLDPPQGEMRRIVNQLHFAGQGPVLFDHARQFDFGTRLGVEGDHDGFGLRRGLLRHKHAHGNRGQGRECSLSHLSPPD
jgi:hypothetical protein